MTLANPFAGACASIVLASLLAAPAAAQPTWLKCSVRDGAGRTASFDFMFDDQARQGTLVLANGAHQSTSITVSPVDVRATFIPANVNIDRRTTGVTYWPIVLGSAGLRMEGAAWTGTCARSKGPGTVF